jgi:hypothetical protein
MTVDQTPRRTRNRCPWGLVGMLGLVVLVEAFVARHRLDFTDTASLSWVMSGEAAGREARESDILCAGDSLAKHGLLPGVIEATSGRKTYNLAAAGASAPTTYFLLRRAIDSGARPSALVVDFMPNLQAGRPRYQVRGWQEFLSFREWLDLASVDRDPSFVGVTAVGALLPSVRARHQLRAAIAAALGGRVDPLPEENRVNRRNWGVNFGANLAARNPAYTGEVRPEVHKALMSDAWATNRVNVTYIRRILDLTATENIAVFWLLPPTSPGLQARREQSGTDAKHTKFVRSMQAAYPHVVVVDARRSGYAADLFVDPVHLDGRGATTLSADVAGILKERHPGRDVAANRWIELPRYRDRPPGMPMEDVEQSRVAWKSDSSRR